MYRHLLWTLQPAVGASNCLQEWCDTAVGASRCSITHKHTAYVWVSRLCVGTALHTSCRCIAAVAMASNPACRHACWCVPRVCTRSACVRLVAHRENGKKQKYGDGPRDDLCCASFPQSCNSTPCQTVPPLAFRVVFRPLGRPCHAWWAGWAHGSILASLCIPGATKAHAVRWPLHASRWLAAHRGTACQDRSILND